MSEWNRSLSLCSMFLLIFPVWEIQTAKHQNHPGPLQKKRGPDTNIFELLMLKHDRAYPSVDSENSMTV